jgi:hypothetical protein
VGQPGKEKKKKKKKKSLHGSGEIHAHNIELLT